MSTREELVKDVDTAMAAWHADDDVGVKCKPHPDAPHGFLRNASHSAGRYVCECEHWKEKNT